MDKPIDDKTTSTLFRTLDAITSNQASIARHLRYMIDSGKLVKTDTGWEYKPVVKAL